ncbi:Cordon-bleu protein-like 1 [Camponotus floridanus]|uniref:Cordon-bleu protein-like 1 n=1 Tax=Camponotus floridanus TaxID=104421 RepID=E2AN35_CAMFO|nr:Cordon-bleu protein-like 1 [Camponotus floridanus]
MMDLLVQIATAHKLTASNYTLQAIGEHGLVLSHHPNTPIGALDVLQVKLLPKQGTCMPRKTKQANQPFETTFRLQVHLPRNQLYVSRVSPKMNLGEILDEVCREKNLDKNNYELRHPSNLEETLDLSLSLQDYHLQEVTLYAKQAKGLGPSLSTQDIMALQRQEERRRQQTKQSVFGFMFKKSKETSLSTDSLGGRSVSPARSDETARSASPLQPPTRPQRKRRPAPKPPTHAVPPVQGTSGDSGKDKMVINHSRNSSDSSGYHEASVLSDNPDLAARLPETLPRRSKAPGMSNTSRKLAQTSQSSKSLNNLAMTGGTLSRGISSTSLTGRKKRVAPPPPTPRPLSSAISTQALERIVDSEESLTSDMDPSKPPSDIGAPSKANSDIDCPKANSDIAISTQSILELGYEPKSEATTYEFDDNIQQNRTAKTETNVEACSETDSVSHKLVKADVEVIAPVEASPKVEQARIVTKKVGEPVPLPMPRKVNTCKISASEHPKAPKRKVIPPLAPPRTLSMERDHINSLSRERANLKNETHCYNLNTDNISSMEDDLVRHIKRERIHSKSKVDSIPFKEDQMDQIEKTKIDDRVSLKSSQYPNHKMDNNFELANSNCMESIIPINPETHFEDKFSKKDEIPEIVDVKDQELLNLSQHLSKEENIGLHSDSIELNELQRNLLLLERNVTSKEEENILQQDCKIKSKNMDSCDENENQDDKSYVLSNSLNKSMPKPDMIEVKSEQLKPSHYQPACQRPPRAPRKRITRDEIETGKYLRPKDATSGPEMKSGFERNKDTCTVISTIPKCDHFDVIREDDTLNDIIKCNIAENANESSPKLGIEGRGEESNNVKITKRTKVIRSQSSSDDFEMDTLKRQKRYLTSPPEDIVHALNLNFSAGNSISSSASQSTEQEQINAGHCINRTRDVDVNERVTDNQDAPSETDILLQKVSDTLSSVLPTSSSPIPEISLPFKSSCTTASKQADVAILDDSTIKSEPVDIKDESNEIYKSCVDLPENTLSASTPNMTATAGSQVNTSDYVSAMSEDLSISDWEYHLPAPPSAFRDSHSPVFDTEYDTITLGSVEAFKDPPGSPVPESVDATDNSKNIESTRNLLNSSEADFQLQRASSGKTDLASETEIDEPILGRSVEQMSVVSHKRKADPDLRREIISELESKIETGALAQTINRDFDRKSTSSLLAPVDNTLSNFTITTYTKQNSIDIFEEFAESRNSDDRFIKTFATLSRSKAEDNDKKNTTKSMHLINNISRDKETTKFEESNALNLDLSQSVPIQKCYNQNELTPRLQSLNEKTNIQRSKSYISISSNAKYQTDVQKIERKHEQGIIDERKSTNITDLNVDVLRGNEKFSQWRDNVLKHQKEPSKEKQLQSLQVLKSILPQLKNAQQAEENISKEYSSALLTEKNRYEPEPNEHLTKTNAASTLESQDLDSECKQLSKEKNTKRYVYTGPPAISLGSWSERPSVNVQIKMDTDYKLGRNNTNSSKTIVNINSAKSEKDFTNYASNVSNKNNTAKHEINVNSSANKNPDELTRKLITHTTASGFKAPMPNRVNAFDSTKNKDRPFVMGVELKKTFVELPKNSENEIDTPINFRELTNSFGQNVNFKQKPKRTNLNRHSANCDIQLDKIEGTVDTSVKQNGHPKFAKAPNQNDLSSKNQSWMHDIQENSQAKRFTSVVGVNGTSQNFRPQNETSLKCNISNSIRINPPMPVVKGFKIPIGDSKMNNNQIKHKELSAMDSYNDIQSCKPPTMPIITGVTLKNTSTRPKSAPVQLDSRDTLLESIRNFGGREKLKSIAGRY